MGAQPSSLSYAGSGCAVPTRRSCACPHTDRDGRQIRTSCRRSRSNRSRVTLSEVPDDVAGLRLSVYEQHVQTQALLAFDRRVDFLLPEVILLPRAERLVGPAGLACLSLAYGGHPPCVRRRSLLARALRVGQGHDAPDRTGSRTRTRAGRAAVTGKAPSNGTELGRVGGAVWSSSSRVARPGPDDDRVGMMTRRVPRAIADRCRAANMTSVLVVISGAARPKRRFETGLLTFTS